MQAHARPLRNFPGRWNGCAPAPHAGLRGGRLSPQADLSYEPPSPRDAWPVHSGPAWVHRPTRLTRPLWLERDRKRVPRAGARLPRGRFVRANRHTHTPLRTLREREREYTEKLKRTYTLREIFDRRAKLASELSRSLGLELYLWDLYREHTHTHASLPYKKIRI